MSGPLSSTSGGSIQGPNYDVNDITDVLKNKAFNTVLQLQMGIATDSLQPGAGLADKGHELHTYDSKADAPVLSHTHVNQIRMALFETETEATGEVAEAFSELLKEVNPQVALRLLQDMQKPPAERNPLYIGIQGALETMSKATVWAREKNASHTDGQQTLQRVGSRAAASQSFSQESLSDFSAAGSATEVNGVSVKPHAVTSATTQAVSHLRDDVSGLQTIIDPKGWAGQSLSEVLKKISSILSEAEHVMQAAQEADRKAFKQRADALSKLTTDVVTQFLNIKQKVDDLRLSIGWLNNTEDYDFFTNFGKRYPEAMGAGGDWSGVFNAMFLDSLKSISLPISQSGDQLDDNSAQAIATTISSILRLLLANLTVKDKAAMAQLTSILQTLQAAMPPSMGDIKSLLAQALKRIQKPSTTTGPAAITNDMSPDLAMQQLAVNLNSIVSGLRKNILAELDNVDANSAKGPVLANYLKQISEAINMVQRYLMKQEAAGATSSAQTTSAQRDMSLGQMEGSVALAKKASEAHKKQETMGILFKVMGPIMAVAFLASIIASGGASLVAIAIAVASVAVSIADSATGFMTKGIQSMMKDMSDWIETWNGGDQTAAQLGSIFITLALIAVLAAATAGASAKCGTGVVTKKLGEEAGAQAASRVATSVSIQVAATLLMSSSVVSKFFKVFANSCGASSSQAEIIGQVMQLITIMLMFLAAGKGVTSAAAYSRSIQNVVRAVTITADVGQLGVNVASAVMHFQLAGLALEKADIQASLEEFQSAMDVLDKSKKKMSDSMTNASDSMGSLAELFNSVIAQEKQMVTGITRA